MNWRENAPGDRPKAVPNLKNGCYVRPLFDGCARECIYPGAKDGGWLPTLFFECFTYGLTRSAAGKGDVQEYR